jgi:O-antigen/teichoic acid export membrane protein
MSLTYGFGMVCGPAILLCGPFLRLWVGSHFAAASAAVAQILMFGAWSNRVAFLPYGFIQARGKPHITAKVGKIEVLPYFAVLWFLIDHMGLVGAALAWTLRVTINCVVLLILSRCFPPNIWRLLPAVILMAGSLLIARLAPMSEVTALALAVVVGLVFAVLAYSLDPMARETAFSAGRRFGILRQPDLLQRDSL